MSDDTGTVWIILVNWNGWEDTLACVRSCDGLSYASRRLLIVDNGSTDGSVERLREALPGVDLIESGENLGFAGANNIGIERALAHGAAFVWLLNNDTVVEPDALTALVESLSADPKAGMATSKIYFFDRPDVIWFAGGTISDTWGLTRHAGENEPDRGQYDEPRYVDYGSGASLLVRAAVIERIGPLDPAYFVYWEETDWCERARQAGWQVLYVPASRVRHKVGASTPPEVSWAKWRYEGRNRVLFYRKNRRRQLPWVVLLALANALYLLVRGRPRSAAALVSGIARGLAGESGPIES